MEITPAVLVQNEADCKAKLFHPGLRKVAKRFHIDVLDGTLVHKTCWADPLIIGSWPNLPEIEIHLMVTHPARHATIWKTRVPTLKNVIVHRESVSNPRHTCEQLGFMGLPVTLAINPLTTVEAIQDLEDCAHELLMMGVEPGASGQAFLEEPILSKIRRARALFPHLPIAVDGGVNTKSARSIIMAGATRLIASSALWSSAEPEEALDELRRCAIMDT
jgi:ribulose-phosphate 3-epimerase